MENKTKKNLERGILAAGGVLTAAAINELLLSKKEHDKKEKEINKLELEKEKYMEKIGAYEPFDIENGAATPNDSKLVNLLTRAVGVAFTNNDVFTRNKSNVRTFPFIISNNSSLSAAIEVELRKYYEVMVASQVANLINHTVFAAENVLNVKDDKKRTVDKIMDKVFSRPEDLSDLGTSLQKGLYENVLFDKDNNVISLNEEYANVYESLEQYLNDYSRMIKTYVKNIGEKNRLSESIEKINESRKNLMVLRKTLSGLNFTLVAGQTLTKDEKDIEDTLKKLLSGKMARDFDKMESEETVVSIRNDVLPNFNIKKYIATDIKQNIEEYLFDLQKYHKLLEKGLVIITNNNYSDPSEGLMDADPYYRLLDLNMVTDYDNSASLSMKMFKNSSSSKIRLEMAAALLISTEILPFEFIEYATKYLDLPMHDKTRRAITMKYGDGTKRLPFSFMGNKYVMSETDSLMSFYDALRPGEWADKKELVKKLTKKQLVAGLNRKTLPLTNVDLSFFDLMRSRKGLENAWSEKHKNVDIDKKLASVYISSQNIDDMAKLKNIDNQIRKQSEKLSVGKKAMISSIAAEANTENMLYGKALSLLGAGGARVHRIIEDRLKNKIINLYSVKDVDKSLNYFLDTSKQDSNFNPTTSFTPNLDQTQKLIRAILGEAAFGEGYVIDAPVTVLTEDLILGLTEKVLEESSYVYNLSTPTRTVTYKEVSKDPIEYILPAYTKGRSLLYGSTEIDMDQFKTRKVGEPIWIKVTFTDKINSMKMDMTDNDFTTVIGIKSEVKRVQEKEINKLLKNPGSRSSELSSILVDQRDQTLGLISKIANKNDLSSASLNGILVVSINEATSNVAAKSSDDYINNPQLALTLKKTYNLTSICLVDSIAEEYFIMEENSSSWSRMPFSELRSGGSNSDLKAIASMVRR